MSIPIIRSGEFHAGVDFECGENVVVEVAEDCVVVDRVTLPDNAYLGGRSIRIGSDFYGYGWGMPWPVRVGATDFNVLGDAQPTGSWLEIGRGRLNEEDARLTVGDRCTFHDNRIDLSAAVFIGDDVGLSPEVALYTHHYWLSVLEGYPQRVQAVQIGDGVIVGYRSCVLAGSRIGPKTVIGAQSVVNGDVLGGRVYGGNPLRMLKDDIKPYPSNIQEMLVKQFVDEWDRSMVYRGYNKGCAVVDFPLVKLSGCVLDVLKLTVGGDESRFSDDLRWHFFKRGVRLFSKRRFKALGKNA